jgi:putative addiction module component (TIGR02574 family)
MSEERKPAMSIDEIEAVLVDLPEEQLDDLMDRVAVRRGVSPEIEQSWMEEVERRLDEVDAGEVELIPVEETIAKMRALLR